MTDSTTSALSLTFRRRRHWVDVQSPSRTRARARRVATCSGAVYTASHPASGATRDRHRSHSPNPKAADAMPPTKGPKSWSRQRNPLQRGSMRGNPSKQSSSKRNSSRNLLQTLLRNSLQNPSHEVSAPNPSPEGINQAEHFARRYPPSRNL